MFEEISTLSMFIYLIILLVILILLTTFVLLVHSGLFRTVEVFTGKPPFGQIVIAYKFAKGPYNQAGQLFTEAAIIAPDNKCIGIYYDDPKKVEGRSLRYVVGSIISDSTSPIDESLVKKFTENDFKILHLPEVSYAVGLKFPHITTLSILIAIHKAYPRLQEYIEERKLCAYPFVEFYDGQTIHFVAPLSKQEEFMVPECEADKVKDHGDGRETTIDSSRSTLDESQVSPDISMDSQLIEESLQSPGQSENKLAHLSSPPQPDSKSLPTDANVNNSNLDSKEENEDKGSDDDNSSSSSFEVIKDETAETNKEKI